MLTVSCLGAGVFRIDKIPRLGLTLPRPRLSGQGLALRRREGEVSSHLGTKFDGGVSRAISNRKDGGEKKPSPGVGLSGVSSEDKIQRLGPYDSRPCLSGKRLACIEKQRGEYISSPGPILDSPAKWSDNNRGKKKSSPGACLRGVWVYIGSTIIPNSTQVLPDWQKHCIDKGRGGEKLLTWGLPWRGGPR